MRYHAEIKASEDCELLYKCFLSESSEKERSAIKISKGRGLVKFNVEANDVVALKASISSIIKLLEVYKKVSIVLK